MSDNATSFTSEEFTEFLKKNGIRHVKTPPYHPASNGMVERAVQTFKTGMKKMREGTIQTKLSRFLFNYRITPHSSTGTSLAELLFGRRLNSHLENLKPSLSRKVQQNQEKQKEARDAHARVREFQVGDKIFVRNYRGRTVWLAGVVTRKEGKTVYLVQTRNGDIIRRHIDQMRSRVGESSMDVIDSQDEPEFANFKSNDQQVTTDPQELQPATAAQREQVPEPLEDDPQNSQDASNTVEELSGQTSANDSTGLRRSSRTKTAPDYYGTRSFY